MATSMELQSLCSDANAPPPAIVLRSPSEAKGSGTYVLEFRDLMYSVKPKRRGSGRLTILHGVSGRCEAGRLLALMGASGAGKTTTVPNCSHPLTLHEHSSVQQCTSSLIAGARHRSDACMLHPYMTGTCAEDGWFWRRSSTCCRRMRRAGTSGGPSR